MFARKRTLVAIAGATAVIGSLVTPIASAQEANSDIYASVAAAGDEVDVAKDAVWYAAHKVANNTADQAARTALDTALNNFRDKVEALLVLQGNQDNSILSEIDSLPEYGAGDALTADDFKDDFAAIDGILAKAGALEDPAADGKATFDQFEDEVFPGMNPDVPDPAADGNATFHDFETESQWADTTNPATPEDIIGETPEAPVEEHAHGGFGLLAAIAAIAGFVALAIPAISSFIPAAADFLGLNK